MRLATAARHIWLQAGSQQVSWHGHVFGEIITLVVRAGCAHRLARITARSLHTYAQIGVRVACAWGAWGTYWRLQTAARHIRKGFESMRNDCSQAGRVGYDIRNVHYNDWHRMNTAHTNTSANDNTQAHAGNVAHAGTVVGDGLGTAGTAMGDSMSNAMGDGATSSSYGVAHDGMGVGAGVDSTGVGAGVGVGTAAGVAGANEMPQRHARYVRPLTYHKAQGIIDDLQPQDDADEANAQVPSVSSVPNSQLHRRQRRISKRDETILKSSQYGQYLEIPRNKKSIFQTPEQQKKSKMQRAMLVGAVLVLILIVALSIAIHMF